MLGLPNEPVCDGANKLVGKASCVPVQGGL